LAQKNINPRWILALEWLVLLLIIAAATFLRFWRIEEVPPGFNSDEAVGALGALTTLREGLKYSYEGQGGGGSLGFYFAAASFYLFGPSIAAIRGVAAWAGVMSIFFNYWAVREVFRQVGLNRARWIAGFSTLALTFSVWHLWSSRVAFATIGVPFLMLPSVYFLWWGLNRRTPRWAFALSGLFLGASLYIYLSGAFAPPLYAAFFLSQWAIVKLANRQKWPANPTETYLTSQFWNLFITGFVAVLVLMPMVYILLTRPELDPSTTRVSQAIFTNPQINQGDPWGLLWRSFVGNFSAYGVSLGWLIGRPPQLSYMPQAIGVLVFAGFLICIWQSLRGQAAYLFTLLWYPVMLLPSILSPDLIPHNLRTIGATTPTYIFAAISVVTAAEGLAAAGQRWLLPRLGQPRYRRVAGGAGAGLLILLLWQFWQVNQPLLSSYFFDYPQSKDAQAAFHVYAVEMAKEINKETNPQVAFILPRNTAAGETYRNFTTDFLVELANPPAAHYWVVDDERTMAKDLTAAAANHREIRVVEWKTSKHTAADPYGAIPYYLEKYGYHDHKRSYEYFNIHTYQLQTPSPDFTQEKPLTPVDVNFGNQIKLTGYALGDAGDVSAVNTPQARSKDLLWLRLSWQRLGKNPDSLKASAIIYNDTGQIITQADKLLLSNIWQEGSHEWDPDETATAYFLIPIPPATPPGVYTVKVGAYSEETLERVPIIGETTPDHLTTLAQFNVVPAQKRTKLEDLTLALPAPQNVLPGLKLIGFETLPGKKVRAGQPVGASIIWQADDPPPATDWQMWLVIKPKEGKTEQVLSQPVGVSGSGYPSSQWRPNEILRGWLSTRIPPKQEPGMYELELRLGQNNTTAFSLPVGEFEITGWQRNFTAPQPQVKIEADFNHQATLLGLDTAAATLSPGDTLNVTLYWRADAEFTADDTAFVQLIGPDGALHGQVDQTPGAGQFPTTGWQSGEYITDTYAVTLSRKAPAGNYQIAVGLYNPATGQRLPVSGGNCQPDVCLRPGPTVN